MKHSLEVINPDDNSKLKVIFSGDPKSGFNVESVSVIKKGEKIGPPIEPPAPPKKNDDDNADDDFLELWYGKDKE